LDFRPLLRAVIEDRLRERDAREIASSFQKGIAHGLYRALIAISQKHLLDTVVLSGGVFQNELLLEDSKPMLEGGSLQVWTNHAVPPNDGGLSLGQAALAAFGRFDSVQSPAEQDAEPDYA
jgi:hydrogenase maturation protein HypF